MWRQSRLRTLLSMIWKRSRDSIFRLKDNMPKDRWSCLASETSAIKASTRNCSKTFVRWKVRYWVYWSYPKQLLPQEVSHEEGTGMSSPSDSWLSNEGVINDNDKCPRCSPLRDLNALLDWTMTSMKSSSSSLPPTKKLKKNPSLWCPSPAKLERRESEGGFKRRVILCHDMMGGYSTFDRLV